MPRDVAFGLHRACGYRPELVAFDIRLQVEPELVIPPYGRAEACSGVEFTFYAPEAIELVTERRCTGLDGQQLADAVADDLRAFPCPLARPRIARAAGSPSPTRCS